jgi:hypothetical protein
MRSSEQSDRTLWIDVTELFGQFALSDHPTGISRVMINLADALAAQHGAFFAKVRPIVWDPLRHAPLTIAGHGLGKLTEFFPA